MGFIMFGSSPAVRFIRVVVAIIVGTVVYRQLHPSSTFAADGDPDWDFNVQQAQELGAPGIVLFTADWCPYCRDLRANVLSRSDIRQELNEHHTFVVVDLTHPTEAALSREYRMGVHGIPLLIRYNADGKETGRTNGMEANDLLQWLRNGG